MRVLMQQITNGAASPLLFSCSHSAAGGIAARMSDVCCLALPPRGQRADASIVFIASAAEAAFRGCCHD